MKKHLSCALIAAVVMTQSPYSLAEEYHGHYGRCEYGCGGYGRGGYEHGGDDGDAAIFLGLSASLLSLSAIDTAEREHRIQTIQQAETEALNYDAKTVPSPVFMNAKSTVEELQGNSMDNQQAAIMIVELNQKFREE